MLKDQLFKTRGLQFGNWLFEPERFSGLSRNRLLYLCRHGLWLENEAIEDTTLAILLTLRKIESTCHSSGVLARSGAPWVRKCGKLPIRENLVITWPYTDCPPDRPSTPQAYQRKISGGLWWGIFGPKTNGSTRFVKHKQLSSFYCNEIGSSAFRLG